MVIATPDDWKVPEVCVRRSKETLAQEDVPKLEAAIDAASTNPNEVAERMSGQ
jgi:hypothetical protein